MTDPIQWERVERNADGTPFDHLVAVSPSKCVTLRLRTDADDNWICAFTTGLLGEKWTLPQVEDWMQRVAILIDEEPITGSRG